MIQSASVLILGAGPAGCAAAISALQRGMSVIVLDRDWGPRLAPGETLHPGAEPLLRTLGVWQNLALRNFPRHTGLWREDVAGQRSFFAYGSDSNGTWTGIQLDRSAFHQILRNHCLELGARLVQVERLEHYDHNQNQIQADGIVYQADAIMDGTGRTAWLASQLGLLAESLGPPQKLRFGWTSAVNKGDGNPVFKQRADGWDWQATVPGDKQAWVQLRHGPSASGMDATWRIFREAAGKGWFLLGDAACFLDPSAAQGVGRALMSGMMSVHLHASAKERLVEPEFAAAEYRRWIGDFFDHTVSALTSQQAATA